MLYNEVILFPESNSAEAFGLQITGNSPTEVYVKVVAYILERYPELVGQKETHFTDDPDRAAQYTGSTRDMVVEGRTVYIKTGFSTKDKWKNLERICQLAGVSFSIGKGGTVKPAPAKGTENKKTTTDIDHAALAAKYAAQPVHDDFYQYNYIGGGRWLKNSGKGLHDEYCEPNLIAYKGWYYYIKPLAENAWGMFRRLFSEKHYETLLVRLSNEDMEADSSRSGLMPDQKVFSIHKDIIYFRKNSAIHCMNLDGSNLRKLDIHKDEWRLYSPYPVTGGLVHMNKRRDSLYFYSYSTGADDNITSVRYILGSCGYLLFFLKPGSSGLIAVFDVRTQTVTNLKDWMPSLKKKQILLIDCRHEIIYYSEGSGKDLIQTHKSRIYGVNFSGELVDVWEAPKLPDFEFDDYSGIVFNGEVYALKTVSPKSKSNNNMIQNHCVYTFTRSGEMKTIYQHEEGGMISQATPVNVVGNAIMLYLGDEPWHIPAMRWSLIPVDSTVSPAENYIILHDPAWVK